MKQRFKHTFILGILFILIANFFVSSYIPVHAANTDVNKDKDRRSIKALRDCMNPSVIDEDDDINNYSDVFDDTGRKELIVVGFDMSKNGVIACTTAVRMGLKAMGLGKSNAQVEKYFIEYITGDNYVPGQTIPNDKYKMLVNAAKLRALAQKAYDKTEPPHEDLRRDQVAGLVNTCFTATTGGGSGFDEGKGDFKVSGLGTFQQKDKMNWKSNFKWLKPNDGWNSASQPAIGDIQLGFSGAPALGLGDWKQDNSDSSSDFYPLRSDISETKDYTRSSIVDCHFVKKNKDWIFSKNVKIKDGKAVFTNSSGEEISTGTDNADVGADADEPSCAANFTNPLAWGICPIVNGIADFVDWIFSGFILPLLKVSPISLSPGGGLFVVWSGFRVIANIVLVIVFIIMIFGQAIGGGLVDAYTAKKVIPRVVIGAIGINLSIYLAAIMVDITNVVGNGLGALITAPFQAANGGNEYKPGALSGVIGFVIIILGALGAYATVKAYKGAKSAKGSTFGNIRKGVFGKWVGSALGWILLFIGLPMLIAAISIFVTLIIRTGIILLCAVSAPIAIALWILPSTEQYFKKWLNMFAKALMVYPIIVVLFAMGDVLAYAFGGDLLSENARFGVNGVVAIFAQILPIFMIGYAFKIAGGILGGINEALLKRGKQAGEFVKGDARDPNSLQSRTKAGLSANTTRARSRLYKMADKNPNSWTRGLSRVVGAGNLEAKQAMLNKADMERKQAQIATGEDSNIRDAFLAWDPNAYNGKLDEEGNALRGGWFRRQDMSHEIDENGNKVLRAMPGMDAVYTDYKLGKQRKAASITKNTSTIGDFQDGLYYEKKKSGFDPVQSGNLDSQYGEIAEELGFSESELKSSLKGVNYRHASADIIGKHSSISGNGNMTHNAVQHAREVGYQFDTYGMSKNSVASLRAMGTDHGDIRSIQAVATARPDLIARNDDGSIAKGGLSDAAMDLMIDPAIDRGSEDYQARVDQLKTYEGRTDGQLEETADRIERMATTYNPDRPMPAGQQGHVEDGELVAGYGGLSSAPVEVQQAARELHATVFGRTPAAPTRPPGAPVGIDDGDPGDTGRPGE